MRRMLSGHQMAWLNHNHLQRSREGTPRSAARMPRRRACSADASTSTVVKFQLAELVWGYAATILHPPLVRHKINRRPDKKSGEKPRSTGPECDSRMEPASDFPPQAETRPKTVDLATGRGLGGAGTCDHADMLAACPGSGAGPRLGGAERLALSEHAPRGQICR